MHCSPKLLKLNQISLHREKIDIEIAIKTLLYFYTYIHIYSYTPMKMSKIS